MSTITESSRRDLTSEKNAFVVVVVVVMMAVMMIIFSNEMKLILLACKDNDGAVNLQMMQDEPA